TYAVPRYLDLTVFPDGPIATPAVDFGDRAIVAGGYLRAMVRAIERAEGARQSDAVEFAYVRRQEAERLSRLSAWALDQTTIEANRLADSFEETTSFDQPEGAEPGLEHRPTRRVISQRFDEALPAESLALLYRAGVRIEEIRKPVRGAVSSDPSRHIR